MPRIVHFEIPYDDAERSKRFYAEAFGWTIQGWGEEPAYQLAATSASGQPGDTEEPGIDGALYKREPKYEGVLVYIDVDSVDTYLDKVKEAGGEVVTGKGAIPNIGWSAIFRDPDGNQIGLFEHDPSVSG
jgi:predicted enzyme related to lactoylglutathione lyase